MNDLSASPAFPVPPVPSEASAKAAEARWFDEEIKPHEGKLRAYLQHRFSGLADPDDLLHETYIRVLRARAAGKPANRSFLYVIARNVAFNLLRRRQIVSIEPTPHLEELPISDDASIPETVARAQEIELLHEALASLPDRCRLIMTLQRIHGLANGEIATQLGISIHTVNAQVVTGLARIRQYLLDRGVTRRSP